MRIPNLQSIGCRPIRHDVTEFVTIPSGIPARTPMQLLEAVAKKFKTLFPEIEFTVDTVYREY
jgi:hypothetical protein